VQKVLNSPATLQVLSPKGLLIAEHSAHDEIDAALPATLKVVRRERYGETILSLIMKNL
jgi:16S rRNA (guanine966-N2)-methyltransferase